MDHGTTTDEAGKALRNVIRIDEAKVRPSRRDGPSERRGDAQRPAGRRGGPPVQRPTLPAEFGPPGHPGRALPTEALHTKAGEVELRVPTLRSLPFETEISAPAKTAVQLSDSDRRAACDAGTRKHAVKDIWTRYYMLSL